jgi:hypothetical protein
MTLTLGAVGAAVVAGSDSSFAASEEAYQLTSRVSQNGCELGSDALTGMHGASPLRLAQLSPSSWLSCTSRCLALSIIVKDTQGQSSTLYSCKAASHAFASAS